MYTLLTSKRAFSLFCLLLLPLLAWGQTPNRFSSGNFNIAFQPGGTYSTGTWGVAGSYGMNTVTNGFYCQIRAISAGNVFFRFYNGQGANQRYEPGSNQTITAGTSFGLSYNTNGGDGNSYTFNAANNTDVYVVRTWGSGTPGTSTALVWNNGNNEPVTVSNVTRSPSGTVYNGQPVVVTATTSASLPAGQRVFIRYTTNSYSTSTVTQMTGSGSTYTATIPTGTNAGGANVSYYIFTTGASPTPNTNGSDADNLTWNLNNNGGSHYTYSPSATYLFNTAGSYATTTNWANGSLPPSNSSVLINATCTLNAAPTLSGITVASGVIFSGGGQTITFQGYTTGSNVFVNNGTVSGALNVTFPYDGSNKTCQVTGNAVSFQNVTIGTTTGNASQTTGVSLSGHTVTNNMTINTGGFVQSGGAPLYGTSSTLIYALTSGTTYTASNEWVAGATSSSSAGYPNNVTVSAPTANGLAQLQMPSSGNYAIGGALTTSASGSRFGGFTMGTATGSLTINGAININGPMTLSSNSNLLNVAGNIVVASSLTVNSTRLRVFGSANTTQNLPTNQGDITVPPITVAKTGGASFGWVIYFPGAGAGATNPVLSTVTLESGVLNLTPTIGTPPNGNGSVCKIASGGTINRFAGTFTGTPTYNGNYTLNYRGNTAVTVGTEYNNSWTNISAVNITNTAGVTLSGSAAIPSGRTLTIDSSGYIALGANALGGAGNLTTTSVTGQSPIIESASTTGINSALTHTGTRSLSNTTIFRYTAGAAVTESNLSALSGLNLQTRTSGTNLSLSGDATIRSLDIGASTTFTMGSNTVTFNRTEGGSRTVITNAGTFSAGTGTVIFSGTNSTTHVLSGTFTLFNVNVTPTAGIAGVDFGGNATITIGGTLRLDAGSFVINTPAFSSNSTLFYNTGSNPYNQSSEWNNPWHVRVGNNTLLQLFQSTSPLTAMNTPRSILGNLTVDAGSTFTLDAFVSPTSYPASATLTVNGNVTCNGTLNLSTNQGGGMLVQGNFSLPSGATLNMNNAPLTVQGTTTMTGTVNGPTGNRTLTAQNGFTAAGTVNLSSGGLAVTGALSVTGTLNGPTSGTPSVTVSTTMNVASGANFNLNNAALTVTGAATVNGTLNGGTNIKTHNFNGGLSIASTGTVTANNGNLVVVGDLVNNGALSLSTVTGADLSITGNWTQNTGATFTGNSRQVTFSGSASNQTIDGTGTMPTIAFFNIDKSSGTFTVPNGFTLGNGTSTARFMVSNGNCDLAGNSITYTGTGDKQLNIINGTVTTGGTSLSGFTQFFNDQTSGQLGGTLNMNGSSDEAMPATSYNVLTLSNAGTKSLGGNITVRTQLNLNDATTLGTGSNNITYGSSALLNVSNTGGLTTTNNIWPNTNGPASLTLNSGSGLTLHANRALSGTLSMLAGNITTGESILTLGTSASSTGTLSLSGTGAIVGNFARWIAASATSYQFPVGTTTNRQLATVNFTSAPSAGGTLQSTFINSTPTTAGLPLTQGAINVNSVGTGYWRIDAANGLTGGSYTATFVGRNFTNVNDVSGLVLIKRPNSSSNWVLDGTHVTGSGTNSAFTISRTGMTGFSEFGVGGDNGQNPLPVTLISFDAKRLTNGQVNIGWRTASEINSAYFEVERSEDGKNYQPILKTQSTGSPRLGARYAFVDKEASAATLYYRLKQVDLDGTPTVFSSVKVNGLNEQSAWSASILPNPITSEARLQLQGISIADLDAIQILTSSGKSIQILKSGSDGFGLDVLFSQQSQNLLPGAYIVRFVGKDGQTQTSRLIKK